MNLRESITTRQCGVALLTVMFILVLLTTMVVYLIEDEYLAVRRVSNHRDLEQIYQMMAGNEQWAVKVLERDMKESTTDHLNEVWHRLLPETQVNEGKMAATVVDMQSKLNLNNVNSRQSPWYGVLQRLLRLLEIDEGLADAVVDWVDQDIDVSGHTGAEDPEYLSADPPYRSANRNFSSIGELIWVAGFNEEIIAALAPFVVALPEADVKLNVNTASLTLHRVIGPGILTESAATVLIEGRGEEGYEAVSDFLVATELAGQGDLISPLISVASEFFEVQGHAQYGRLNGAIYSVLEKNTETQQVKVLRRRRGFS